MRKLLVLAIALLVAGPLTANATAFLGTDPGANRIPIPATLAFGGGPITWGNYTFTSTNLFNGGGSVFGYTSGYGFGANGSWDAAVGPIIGLNDDTDTMTIAFTNPVTNFGDFFNYAPGGTAPTIIVRDTSGNIIDVYTLTFLTNGGVDTGQWIDFSENVNIGYVTFTGGYIGIADTPEPSTISLILLGVAFFAGAMILARKKGASFLQNAA